MKQIGIIGAGAAGLCSLRHVLSNEEFSPIVWEHSSDVGGTWVYTPNTGVDDHGFPIHSSMYDSLKTNLPKEIMAFPDFPFKEEEKSFIHHTEVLQYLNDYTDHFALRSWIKFNHHVDWVEPVEKENGPPAWKITVKDLIEGTSSDVECDGLIVCNGHYSIPRIPDIEDVESFLGKKSHSHDYRIPDPFTNSKVVILGASASGLDISLEVAKVAKEVYLSHNRPLPIPSKLPSNLHQVKGVKGARSDGFTLTDGSFVEADTIIYCTGYNYTFPFLSPSCGVEIEDNRVKPLYKHVVHSTFPSISFIGIPFTICPFPIFDVQVRYIISVLEGRVTVPSSRDVNENSEEKGTLNRHYHQLDSKQWAYADELTSMAKTQPLPSYIKTIWDIVWWRRIFILTKYKHYNYSRRKGETETVETLDGQVVYTLLNIPLTCARQALKLLIFHMPTLFRLMMASGYNKLRKVSG